MFALKASSLCGHQGAMRMWERPAYLPSKAVCFWSQSLIFKDLIIFIFYLYPLPNIRDLKWRASKKPHLNLCAELTGPPQQLWSESFPSSSEFKCWNLNTKAMRPGGGIWSLTVRGQSPNQWNQALGSFFQHVRKQIMTFVTLKANYSPDSKSTVALVWDFFIYWKYEKWIYIECDTLFVVAVAVGMEWILSFHSSMINTLKITHQCP